MIKDCLQWNFPLYTGKVTTQAGTLAQFKRKSQGLAVVLQRCMLLPVYALNSPQSLLRERFLYLYFSARNVIVYIKL